jgi:hypothetical protein
MGMAIHQGRLVSFRLHFKRILHDRIVTPAYRPRSRPRAGQAGANHENLSHYPPP